MSYDLNTSLKGEIKKQLSIIENKVTSGQAKDFPEYKYMVGQVLALRGVISRLEELTREED